MPTELKQFFEFRKRSQKTKYSPEQNQGSNQAKQGTTDWDVIISSITSTVTWKKEGIIQLKKAPIDANQKKHITGTQGGNRRNETDMEYIFEAQLTCAKSPMA